MQSPMTPEEMERARRTLSRRDSVLRPVIRTVGPCRLVPYGSRFEMLVKSIVSQQISGAAARTILSRLKKALPRQRISPAALLQLSDEQFQQIGVSRQKRGYIRDLAQRTADGEVSFRRLVRLPDEDVIETLTQVRGIGVWSAQMFLMFGLGRPDVFPSGDLGIRNAIARLYGSEDGQLKEEPDRIAEHWAPFRTVASWYLWRSLDT